MFSFLLGVHLGVEFLDHLVTLSLTFLGAARLFSTVATRFFTVPLAIQNGTSFSGGCILAEDEEHLSQSKELRKHPRTLRVASPQAGVV